VKSPAITGLVADSRWWCWLESPSPETTLRYKSNCSKSGISLTSERFPLVLLTLVVTRAADLPETRQSTARPAEGDADRPAAQGRRPEQPGPRRRRQRRRAPRRPARSEGLPSTGKAGRSPDRREGPREAVRCGAVRTSLVDGKNISRASETSVSDVSGRSQRCSSPETRETSEVHHV
jgi:hypothetical protein